MSDNDIGQPQKRPPTWAEVVGRLHPLFGLFALVEYPTGWWVWLWRSSTSVRTLIEFAGAAIIVAGIIGLYLEREDRKEDRSTRNAQLIAQIESLAAINNPKNADPGVRAVMEFAAREKVSMANISVQGVNLFRANLRAANLKQTNFTGANLDQAKFTGANLTGANFTGASLSSAIFTGAFMRAAKFKLAKLHWVRFNHADLLGADFRESIPYAGNYTNAILDSANFSGVKFLRANFAGASFIGTNLTGANLSGAIMLQQSQIDSACVKRGGAPPSLPGELVPPKKVCPDR